MNLAIWILSGLLALAFLAAGFMKVSTPYAKLTANPQMAWANDFSAQQVRGIGIAEILGAIGLILPWALDILPILTPLAALGLTATMIGAVLVHRRRGEAKALPAPAVLGVLAAVVMIVRLTQL